MCGIVGIYNYKGENIEGENFLIMRDSMIHRGPDSAGLYIEDNIALGFRRLSIIDLSENGNQPMFNEDNSIALLFNGEIYNYKELRRELILKGHKFKSNTDTEVILHLYEEYGKDLLQYIYGMFAIAIWDKNDETLFIARDRFGIKPIYYYNCSGTFIFASEIKAILKYNRVDKEINNSSVFDYFQYSYVPMPNTIYKNIFHLEPATAMTINRQGDVNKWKYWNLDTQEDNDLKENEIIEKLDAIFERIIKQYLNADVPVGIMLSGGMDSSLLVSLADKYVRNEIYTFSAIFPDDDKYNEESYQNLISDKFKTKHFSVKFNNNIDYTILQQFDQPFAINSVFPLSVISKLASEKVKVILTGDGADEIFGGYYYYYNRIKRLSNFKIVPLFIRHFVFNILGIVNTLNIFKQSYNYQKVLKFFNIISDNNVVTNSLFVNNKYIVNNILKDNVIKKSVNFNEDTSYENILKIEFNNRLISEMLTKTDFATSQYSLEGRVPFLDKELIELAFKIPYELKVNSFEGKIIFKKFAKKYIPREISHRKKQGFNIPTRYILDIDNLTELLSKNNDYLNVKYINQLLKKYKDGEKRWEPFLYMIYLFLIWYNKT